MSSASDSLGPLAEPDQQTITEKLIRLNSEYEYVHVSENSRPHIHRLPAELIAKVFLYSDNDRGRLTTLYPTMSNHTGFCDCPSVVQFSEVCKSWRDIAVSTPSLWSRFRINCGGVEIDRLDKILGRLRLFLRRSKSHRLAFSISWGAYRPSVVSQSALKAAEDSVQAFSTAISALVDNSDRWYDVHFDWSGFNSAAFQPFERLTGGLPQLKDFRLSCKSYVSSLPPALRNAIIHPTTPTLDSVYFFTATALDLVSIIPRAREVELRKVHGTAYRGPVVTGTDATKITLGLYNDVDFSSILDHCILPNLQTLEASRHGKSRSEWDDLWNISSLTNFVRASGYTPNLRKLSLADIPIKDTEVIELFAMIPSIEKLTISESCFGEYGYGNYDLENLIITDAFLHRLTRTHNSYSGFLPRLKELHVSMTWTGLDQQAFVDAVASRTAGSGTPGEHLSSVSICLESGGMSDVKVLAKIGEFGGADLKISIECPDSDDY